MKNEMKNFLSAVTFEGPIMNSDNAVFLFTVKDGRNARKALIKTGCFNGNEEFIRLKVGAYNGKMSMEDFTIIKKDGNSFSWHFGGGSHSMVSDETNAASKLITETIEEKIGLKLNETLKEDFFKKFSE